MSIQNSKFANFRIMKRGTIQQCDNNLCFLETLPAVLCRLVADFNKECLSVRILCPEKSGILYDEDSLRNKYLIPVSISLSLGWVVTARS